MNAVTTEASRQEARRIRTYREISKITRWEETLRTLYEHSRGNAVAAANANNPTATAYYNGRADGIEELIMKCKKVESLKSKTLKQDDDEEVEIVR